MFEVELSSDRREDPCLQRYLQSIGRYKLLTKDEEFRLASRIRSGERGALDHLVNANLRFVVSVAKKFLNHGLSYMDLIAEGNIGLITAAKRFDERREFRFISYAVWWIRQAIQKAIAEHTNTVRLPINRTQQAHKIKRVARILEQKHQRTVNEEEISEAMGLSTAKIEQIRAASRPLLSLDGNAHDEDWSIADSLADEDMANPEEGFLDGELQMEMNAALRLLNPRERDIVVRYYGLGDDDPASLETIGRDIRLSRERVRQIRNQALARIRKTTNGVRLLAYLS